MTVAVPVTLPTLPALVVGKVHHTRHRPVLHQFTHGSDQWLIDLDDPPRIPAWLRPLATLKAQDHLDGAPTHAELKASVRTRLEEHGIPTADDDRVVMLAYARTLGHVFDPMSAFWCLDRDDHLRGVVIEVRNTYGGRHTYVVPADQVKGADLDKVFYVSPFNDVSGSYRASLRLGPERVAVSIRLDRDGSPVVTATVSGRPRPATNRAVLARFARRPFMAQRVSALIRAHGIWLWLRRLPVHPRTTPLPLTVQEPIR